MDQHQRCAGRQLQLFRRFPPANDTRRININGVQAVNCNKKLDTHYRTRNYRININGVQAVNCNDSPALRLAALGY